jgi:hypothetical protein
LLKHCLLPNNSKSSLAAWLGHLRPQTSPIECKPVSAVFSFHGNPVALAGPALAGVFADPGALKVLHGSDSDVVWLQRDFGLFLVNMFDTGQVSLASPFVA